MKLVPLEARYLDDKRARHWLLLEGQSLPQRGQQAHLAAELYSLTWPLNSNHLSSSSDRIFPISVSLAPISRSVVTEDRKEISGAAQLRLVKKELAKVEKQLERVIAQEQELIKEQESASFDHQRLLEVGAKLTDIGKVRSELEDKWLELSGQVKE